MICGSHSGYFRDRQGLAIKIAMGLYFCPDIVERLLYPGEAASHRILDVGKYNSELFDSIRY
jgi:hypothetical protein